MISKRDVQARRQSYEANILEPLEAQDSGHVLILDHLSLPFTSRSKKTLNPELDHEFLQTSIAQEDADALMVSTFEIHEALTRYMEARSKLVEKKASRGF